MSEAPSAELTNLSLGHRLLVIDDSSLDYALEQVRNRPRSEHDAKTLTDAIAFFEHAQQQFTEQILSGQPVTPLAIGSPVDWAVMPPTRPLNLLWRDFQRWASRNNLQAVLLGEVQPGRTPKQSLTVRSAFGAY